jgi:hypothetical protein
MVSIALVGQQWGDSLFKLILRPARAEWIHGHYSTNGALVIVKLSL